MRERTGERADALGGKCHVSGERQLIGGKETDKRTEAVRRDRKWVRGER